MEKFRIEKEFGLTAINFATAAKKISVLTNLSVNFSILRSIFGRDLVASEMTI